MKIEDDDFLLKEKKPRNKIATIISILIVITIIIVAIIIFLMVRMEKEKLVVMVNGQKITPTAETFRFVEGTGEVYVSIKDIAPYVGYEAHNGEYKVNSEDISKTYVEAVDGTETTSFYQNSTLINKVPPNSDAEYETIQIREPVTESNGKLYINAEGFMQGFNSILTYDQVENQINIQTLPYLVTYYTNNISNYGYDALSTEFNNQKALIYGLIVASKQTTGKYGVIDSRTNREIISPRYNEIEFIESSGEFIITNSSNKVGIAYSTGETKINVQYDEIKVLDSERGYYLVKSNEKYGVINSDEELVIHIEYDKIGADISDFPADNLDSQYILFDKVIPVSLNEKWGLFDVEGKKITEVEYDGIGCINDEITDRVVNNVLVIGDTEVVVVYKDGLYGGVSLKGDLLLPIMFDYIYSITSGGETTYYMVAEEVDYKALDLITAMKKALGYEEAEEKNENEGTSSEGTGEQNQGENTNANQNVNNNENTENNVNVDATPEA